MSVIHKDLVERIDISRQRGDSILMERFALQLELQDNLSEEAARGLIEARALAGDRIGALRHFSRWRQRLSNELGAQPSRAMLILADRLKQSHNAYSSRTSSPTQRTPHKIEPFVGRNREFVICFEAWERVKNRFGETLFISGEEGIGKTTFINRLETLLTFDGAFLAKVLCYSGESSLAGGTLATLIAALIELPGARATPSEKLQILSNFAPSVADTFANLAGSLPTNPDSSPIHVADALASLIECVTDERPLIISIEDIEASDDFSTAILHLTFRLTRSLPLLSIVTTSRSVLGIGGLSTNETSSTNGDTCFIEVSPLSDSESAQLLQHIMGKEHAPGSTVNRALIRGAGGNPMALELLALDWQHRGRGSIALAAASPDPGHTIGQSQRFKRLVTGALSNLSDDERAAAQLAAVLGDRLNELELYSLVDLSLVQALRALDSLTVRGVLRDMGSHLAFANVCIRAECYSAIAAPLRRHLHSHIANWLKDQRTHASVDVDLELAGHLMHAQREDEATSFLLSGGRSAINLGTPHEADLAILNGSCRLSGSSLILAKLLRAEALQEIGEWDDLLNLMDHGQDEYDAPQLAQSDIIKILARRWTGPLSPNEYQSSVRRLISLSVEGVPPSVRVMAAAAAVRMLTVTRSPEDMESLQSAISDISQLSLDTHSQLHLTLVRAWILGAKRQLPDALSQLSEGVDLALHSGIQSSIAVRLLLGKSNILALFGRYSEAEAPLQAAYRLADRLSNKTLLADASTQLGTVYGRLGRSTEQLDWSRKALSLYPNRDCGPGAIGAYYELGLALASQSCVNEAECLVDDFLHQRRGTLSGWRLQAALLCGADVLALAGNFRKAARLGRRATSGINASLLHLGYAGPFARWVATTATQGSQFITSCERIIDQVGDVTMLDLKDRIEVMASLALINEKGGTVMPKWGEVTIELESGPPGIIQVLRAFGMHPDRASSWGVQSLC
jgi:tetratricopeptide (TPR) repeat protein